MTREEAIARIIDHKIVHKMNEPRAVYISETLEMAIKALEQEPCDKCVYLESCEVSEYDKDHIWYKGHQYISLRRFLEVKAETNQKPCDDVVSRQAVLKTLNDMDNVLDENRTIENYKELLKECYEVLPSVRPQEQTGHWIKHDTGHSVYYDCSRCSCIAPCTETADAWLWKLSKYCPDCGAKMIALQERSE